MQFVLTTRDPYNANYCTPEGQVIYKVVGPYHLLQRRRATIEKVVPTDSEGELHSTLASGLEMTRSGDDASGTTF